MLRTILLSMLLAVVLATPAAALPHKACGTHTIQSLVSAPSTPWHAPRPGGRGFPEVGETRDFWTYDLSVMPPSNAKIPATCRGIGDHCAIWIADDVWGGSVTQDDVDLMLAALETGALGTPESGIIANNEGLFGAPPHFAEGDPDLTLLAYDIAGYNNYEFDGFFRREDLDPFQASCESNPMLYCSNELGMIHVNADNIGTDYMMGVIAHEYQHLAHYGQDPYEESWLDETLAELAMAYSGYEDPYNVQAFVDNPALPLIIEAPVHYGACFYFGSYLYELDHEAGIQSIVSSPKKGTDSLDTLFPDLGGFPGIFGRYAAANLLDEPNHPDGPFGHSLIDVGTFPTTTFGSVEEKEVSVSAAALKYVELNWMLGPQETYSLTFAPGDSEVVGYAVNLPSTQVWELQPNHALEFPVLDDPRVLIALANPNPDASANVTLSVELVEGVEPVVEEPTIQDIVTQDDAEGTVDAPSFDDLAGSEDNKPPLLVPDADVDEAVMEWPVDDDNDSGSCSTTGSASSSGLFVLLLALIALTVMRSRATAAAGRSR